MNFLFTTTFKAIDYKPENLLPLLENNKVTLVRDYNLATPPLDFFEHFSDQLGHIFNMDQDLLTGKSTGKRWIPISYDPNVPDKYRSAPVAQPLHTDASYRETVDNINFFFCESQAELGGATTFIDSNYVVELLKLAGEGQLLDELMSTRVVFSKDRRRRVEHIIWEEDNDLHMNWNYYTVDKTENDAGVLDLVERFHQFLERRIVPSGLVTAVMLRKNDVVFFNDERILHGRQSYFAKYKGQRSLIKGCIILESRMDKNPWMLEHERQQA